MGEALGDHHSSVFNTFPLLLPWSSSDFLKLWEEEQIQVQVRKMGEVDANGRVQRTCQAGCFTLIRGLACYYLDVILTTRK